MVIAKTFYFLFFGAMACLVPFLTLHYRDLGLSGGEIGILTGVVPLIGMAGASLWGMLADASGRHHQIFLSAIAGTWIAVFVLTRVQSFQQLLPVIILYAVCVSPIIPLADDAVMDWLGPQRRGDYGRQRVWGSYGWGVAGAVVGILIAAGGLGWTFTSFLGFYILLFLVGTRLPMNPSKAGSYFWRDVRQLMSNHAWILFLAVALVEGMSLGIFLNYLFLYLETMGGSPTIMGLTLTMATLSEIPIFLYSRRLLGRWSPPFLLAMSLLFTVIRAFAFAGMTAPWQSLLINLLHGPTFALMWVAGVAYATEIAPKGLGATAQGLLGGVTMGLGSALGAFIGGFLYDAYGLQSLFYFAGVASMAAFTLFVSVNHRAFRRQLQSGWQEI